MFIFWIVSIVATILFTYAFMRLGPLAKILLGYLIAGTLFIFRGKV
ncbi:MAG: hypothetical protein NC820_05165 [Candidatus Omnitrophica bacterium]|nr:hypothetical protein [Candidatus Omnitrophota bacterium]